jgi:hypothetical protein
MNAEELHQYTTHCHDLVCDFSADGCVLGDKIATLLEYAATHSAFTLIVAIIAVIDQSKHQSAFEDKGDEGQYIHLPNGKKFWREVNTDIDPEAPEDERWLYYSSGFSRPGSSYLCDDIVRELDSLVNDCDINLNLPAFWDYGHEE